MLYLKDIDVSAKKVLIRVDYNVPLDGTRVTDDTRIRESLPTLRHILSAGGALVLCCHLGQPKGEVKPEFSLAPVAAHLAGLLGISVPLASDCVGAEVKAKIAALASGEVLMLENLRFHKAETSKDAAERMAFAKELMIGLDLYVSDAFGVAHRPNASVTEAPLVAPKACAGFLMEKEWEYLHGALESPKRPFVAVSGGSKVSSKLGILKNLLGKVDHLIIGGAMANTFRLAQGIDMGASLVERELLDEAKSILDAAADAGTHIHLPVDFVLAKSFKDAAAAVASHTGAVPADLMALDIGPKSVLAFAFVLKGAGTVVWNGPMGAFENPAFAAGSIGMAKAIVECGALSIVGGGDTDAVVHAAHLGDKFSFISTGGGSFLEFLEGKELPGFKALEDAAKN
jgi:phosphoglycerate kinase